MKTINVVAWAALSISAFLAGLIIYWSLQPFKPIIRLETPITIQNDPVKIGEDLILEYRYCKDGTADGGIVARYIEGAGIYWLPEVRSNVEVGCKNLVVPIELPKNLVPGTYTYNSEITYEVNPIKKSTYYFKSEPFKLVKE